MRIVLSDTCRTLGRTLLGGTSKVCLTKHLYASRLTFYDFDLPATLPSARSIIVIAAPSPQTPVTFTQNGHTVALTIPPTYVGYNLLPKKIEAILTGCLAPQGYHTVRATLPLKTL